MKVKKILIAAIAFLAIQTTIAQDEMQLIKITLMDYIEGTANGEPDRVTKAFHLNLTYIAFEMIV